MKRIGPGLAAALIFAAILAAYSNCFSAAFVLDDKPSILRNTTLRNLGDLKTVLTPLSGGGLTVDGRPVLNLSFAVNYAISGPRAWSYHAANLLIHGLAALVLFGLVRRLLAASSQPNSRFSPVPFAFAVALLWAVHPLNTESVTYVAQRAESLMGLCFLLTLYGFVRSSGRAAGGFGWSGLSVLCCFLGMATKEVMVSAPLAVLLVDRLCFAGSLAGAWRQRKGYYSALASSWILLAWLVWHTGSRGGTSGPGSGVPAWQYWETQPLALVRYVRLALLPSPLVFDYGTEWVAGFGQVVGPLLLVAAAFGAALFGVVRNRAWGLLGFLFFAVLAPTSLVPGNRQTAAEHRMYLALIPLVVAALAGTEFLLKWMLRLCGRTAGPAGQPDDALRRGPRSAAGLAGLALVAAVPASVATFERNLDYASELRLYGDAAGKMPGNAYAQANYATALLSAGDYGHAKEHFEAALRANPTLQVAENNLGNVYFHLGRYGEAEAHYRNAVQINPRFAKPHNNLAEVFLRQDRVEDALREVEVALSLDPELADARMNLGLVLLREGHLAEALAELGRATALAPESADARVNYGNALRAARQPELACGEYARAAQLEPQNAQVFYDWGSALMDLHRYAEAEKRLRIAVEADPSDASTRQNLGNALLAEDRAAEAVEQYAAATTLAPGHALAHYNYANGLLRLGRREEAVGELRRALRLDPGLAPADQLLQALGR